MFKYFLLLAISVSSILAGEVALRAAGAKGKLLCGTEPYHGAKIKFFRINTREKSQLLDTAESNAQGMFEVSGNTQGRAVNETTMSPVVRIYHKCDENPSKDHGFRNFQIQLPSDFVFRARSTKKLYDIGEINLKMIYPAERKDKKIDEH